MKYECGCLWNAGANHEHSVAICSNSSNEIELFIAFAVHTAEIASTQCLTDPIKFCMLFYILSDQFDAIQFDLIEATRN